MRVTKKLSAQLDEKAGYRSSQQTFFCSFIVMINQESLQYNVILVSWWIFYSVGCLYYLLTLTFFRTKNAQGWKCQITLSHVQENLKSYQKIMNFWTKWTNYQSLWKIIIELANTLKGATKGKRRITAKEKNITSKNMVNQRKSKKFENWIWSWAMKDHTQVKSNLSLVELSYCRLDTFVYFVIIMLMNEKLIRHSLSVWARCAKLRRH